MQHLDFAAWTQRAITAQELARQLDYWVRQLTDVPEVLRLPTERRDGEGAQHGFREAEIRVSTVTLEDLHRLAMGRGMAISGILLSSWAVLLSRWSGQDDIAISTTVTTHHQEVTLGDPRGNPVVIRVRMDDDPEAGTLLDRVQTLVNDSAIHNDVSIEEVIQALNRARGAHPLAHVSLAVTSGPSDGERQNGLSEFEERVACVIGGSGLLALSFNVTANHLSGRIRFSPALFTDESVQRIVESWKTLLYGLVTEPDARLSRLPILSAAERLNALHAFNPPMTTVDENRLIHTLVEEQTRRTPQAVALICQGQTLTYEELGRRSNQLARYLIQHGVGPDQFVGICLERGFDLIIAILAVLKAGGAYLPLDPGYPAERLSYMLEDAAPRLVLAHPSVKYLPKQPNVQVLDLDLLQPTLATFNDADLDSQARGLTSRHLAYVIYTSGSTGAPKAALNEHRGMVNRILAQRNLEALSPADVCCHKTSISFVDAVLEILGPLCAGASLVIVPSASLNDVAAVAKLVKDYRVTHLLTVPSLARAMLEDSRVAQDLSGLRLWTLSGEEVRAELLHSLQRRFPRCEFLIQYGSSEVSSDAAIYQTRAFVGDRVPLGRPLANVQIYVLDRHQEPVPLGVIGELYVGGIGVGRGYLGRPELTAARYIRDPFGSAAGRLYRTGDLGRWNSRGLLEYLGRADHQVKVRGFRIELGEIEAQLLRHPGVTNAVVVAKERSGHQQLIAYLASDSHSISPASLRARLSDVLPEYMVPTAFVVMKRLPHTPNGKLDRRALPEPGLEAYVTQPYERPQGPRETLLAQIWEEVLHIAPIGRHAHFFQLGGHSLLIVQMLERLRREGFSLEATQVYSTDTLAELALGLVVVPQAIASTPDDPASNSSHVALGKEALAQPTPEELARVARAVPGGTDNIEQLYPLTPLQEGILFHHVLSDQGGDAYLLSAVFSLASRETLDRFIGALNFLMARHEVLRTAFLWEHLARPVQVVLRAVSLPVQEPRLHLGPDIVGQLERHARHTAQKLDVRQAPLLRLWAAADPHSARYYALLEVHHLVCDNVSLETLIEELQACVEGRAHELPPSMPYRTHVLEVLARAAAQDSKTFFQGKLGQVDEPTAPLGLLNTQRDAGQIEEFRGIVSPGLSDRLRAGARGLGLSAATVFHAAWALVVSHTSGQVNPVFGSVLLGRLHGAAGVHRALGMFINTLPLRIPLQGLTVRELVRRTHQELTELLRHDHASLAEAQRCSAVPGTAPLFTSLLNYMHAAAAPARQEVANTVQVLAIHSWTHYPIVLSVEDSGQAFTLHLETDHRIDPQRIFHYMHTALNALVNALESAPDGPALALAVLATRERDQVLLEFNATDAVYPRNQRVEALFEEQVRRTPEAIAVVWQDVELSYRQLNQRAEDLADYLVSRGLRAGEFVPIVMSRSLLLLIAQLAVLKCGSAYLPLDPVLPASRKAFIIEDCRARWVLVDGEGDSEWAARADLEVIDCNTPLPHSHTRKTAEVSAAAQGLDAAYVMYTSGSTGIPKGVIVPHRAVSRLVLNCGYIKVLPTDCFSHLSNPAFDAATFEVWAPLLNGARVVIVPQSILFDAQALALLLAEQRVTVFWMTIGLLTQYIDSLVAVLPQFRYVFTGGDVVEPQVVHRLRQHAHTASIFNAYGPTEGTTFSTLYPTSPADDESPSLPIGRPIANTRVYILDAFLNPVPVGVTGELYIGGDGVAIGYLNRPELTAQRFICDPFSTDCTAHLYRTGDLGRWRADGNIEFLGRNDQQVKLRGYRIELGEIEARLLAHPDVGEAAVIVQEDDSRERRLVAYVTSTGKRPTPVDTLRQHLSGTLPDYMIPSAIMRLDRLPLTATGKLDRRALPVPPRQAFQTRAYTAPEGEMEQAIAKIWEELLRVSRIGRDDHFFELGGHSLLAMQVMVRLRSVYSIEFPISALMDFPTVRQLAEQLTARRDQYWSDRVAAGGQDMDELLEQLSRMPEGQAREMLNQLKYGVRT